ncbi:MAG: type I pantothenate kinase [Burkholderiaceae bacterium]
MDRSSSPSPQARAYSGVLGRRQRNEDEFAAYEVFSRSQWAALRSNTPLTLSEDELVALRGVNDQVSLVDVEQIYLPLSRLLNLHFRSARNLGGVRDEFLGRLVGSRPYVIAVAGSVAVGKSTFARVLQALLARWPDHPRVSLITTDGFLYPNAELERRGLMGRKGFPESYDRRRMLAFLSELKAGASSVHAPVYSHEAYDILAGDGARVDSPDVLIFEGLNVLQTGAPELSRNRADEDEWPQTITPTVPNVVVSDFFDFSIYVHAQESDIETWYINRFVKLQQTVFRSPSSYFYHYRNLTESEARKTAAKIWRDINLPNLRQNIYPTHERANVVLNKRLDHAVEEIHLRQI